VASLKDREPVALQYAVAVVPIVAAFALQVLDAGGIDTPTWLRAFLTGIGALIGAMGAVWARARVHSPVTVAARTLTTAKSPSREDTKDRKTSAPYVLGAPQNLKNEFPAGSVKTGTGPEEVAKLHESHRK
jgi:hypothetical protein